MFGCCAPLEAQPCQREQLIDLRVCIEQTRFLLEFFSLDAVLLAYLSRILDWNPRDSRLIDGFLSVWFKTFFVGEDCYPFVREKLFIVEILVTSSLG